MSQALIVMADLALAVALLGCLQLPAGLRLWLVLLSTIALVSAGKVISLLWGAPLAMLLLVPSVLSLLIYSRLPRPAGINHRADGLAPNWTRLVFVIATSLSFGPSFFT